MIKKIICGILAIAMTLPVSACARYDRVADITLDRTAQVAEHFAKNSDTVGWLRVVDTTIDKVVMQKSTDKNIFYNIRTSDKKSDSSGTLYADYRDKFGDGKNKDFSNNITLYWHSLSDDPNDSLYAPIKNYRNEEFARNHPYVFFSTSAENTAWEVFAVFDASTKLPYNRPDLSDVEFSDMLEHVRKGSIYNYNQSVTKNDKILALSTCTYSLLGEPIEYPNPYRFVVMAKLVKPTERVKQTADFTINLSPANPSENF